MADSMLPASNINCTLSPWEIHYDFEDASRFKKLSFPEETALKLDSLLQLAPSLAAAQTLSGAYVLRFPEGIHGALVSLRQGGFNTTFRGQDGRFVGTASLYEAGGTVLNLMNIFTVASFATGQYFLSHITTKLSEVRKSIDDILKFLNDDKRSQLIAELIFVKYAASNFSSIMLSEPQRTATLTNLQRSKIAAISNIEFYTTQLEDKTSSKKAGKPSDQCPAVLQTKQTLDLAMQLYTLSSVMEAYYSQNWDTLYLKNLHDDMDQILTVSKNRMVRALSAFERSLQEARKNVKVIGVSLSKGDYSPSEHNIFKMVNALSEETGLPLLALADQALQSPKKETELYLTSGGDIYQKLG